jgi:DNA-binding NtrC family response regulator
VGRKRILIVEDEPPVAQALRRALNLPNGGGYLVESCESGEAALEFLKDAPFDLIISDLRLPGMNGLELIALAHQRDPQLRSVLITAFGSPQVEEKARLVTDAYVPKPFHLRDMIQIVRRILNDTHDRMNMSAGEWKPS